MSLDQSFLFRSDSTVNILGQHVSYVIVFHLIYPSPPPLPQGERELRNCPSLDGRGRGRVNPPFLRFFCYERCYNVPIAFFKQSFTASRALNSRDFTVPSRTFSMAPISS